MEYEITVRASAGNSIIQLHSDERRHARSLRELAEIAENGISVEVMRTARRPVRFAGIDKAETPATSPVKKS